MLPPFLIHSFKFTLLRLLSWATHSISSIRFSLLLTSSCCVIPLRHINIKFRTSITGILAGVISKVISSRLQTLTLNSGLFIGLQHVQSADPALSLTGAPKPPIRRATMPTDECTHVSCGRHQMHDTSAVKIFHELFGRRCVLRRCEHG
jgi:hypothetical protein